jgi:hypothetical protein
VKRVTTLRQNPNLVLIDELRQADRTFREFPGRYGGGGGVIVIFVGEFREGFKYFLFDTFVSGGRRRLCYCGGGRGGEAAEPGASSDGD